VLSVQIDEERAIIPGPRRQSSDALEQTVQLTSSHFEAESPALGAFEPVAFIVDNSLCCR